MSDQEPDHEYGLVMPFIVCEPDGPYEAGAFVAGCYFGQLQAEMHAALPGAEICRYIPSPLTPQIDLLAMDKGWSFTAEPWEDHPEDWTYVELKRLFGVAS